MSTPTLAINDVFKIEDGTLYRYLGPGNGDEAHVIEMQGHKPRPEQWSRSELAAFIAAGSFALQEASGQSDIPEPNDTDIEGRKKRMAWIQPLVDDEENKVLYRSTRATALESRSKEINVSTESLMACLRLYWLGGQDEDALRTKNYLKGTPKPRPAGAPFMQLHRMIGHSRECANRFPSARAKIPPRKGSR